MTQKLALVAGSVGGIGIACVEALHSASWEVVGIDRPELDIAADSFNEDDITEALKGRKLDGGVHAIGMSARRQGDGILSKCADEGWNIALRVNLTSAFRFLRYCIKNANDGASFVLVGSALASTLDEDFLTTGYRVAKGALIPLIEIAAYEGAPRNIRVNMVSPGLVDTPMAARALSNPDIIKRFPELLPLGKSPAKPEEVANGVEWLLGSKSSRTTGAVLPVDGGWTLK